MLIQIQFYSLKYFNSIKFVQKSFQNSFTLKKQCLAGCCALYLPKNSQNPNIFDKIPTSTTPFFLSFKSNCAAVLWLKRNYYTNMYIKNMIIAIRSVLVSSSSQSHPFQIHWREIWWFTVLEHSMKNRSKKIRVVSLLNCAAPKYMLHWKKPRNRPTEQFRRKYCKTTTFLFCFNFLFEKRFLFGFSSIIFV